MTVAAGILVLLAVAAWASGRFPEHLVAVAFFTALPLDFLWWRLLGWV